MVGTRGDSNHDPVFLEVSRRPMKLVSPFKFNSTCLQEEEFINMVKGSWIPIGQEDRVVVQFSQNLKILKSDTME